MSATLDKLNAANGAGPDTSAGERLALPRGFPDFLLADLKEGLNVIAADAAEQLALDREAAADLGALFAYGSWLRPISRTDREATLCLFVEGLAEIRVRYSREGSFGAPWRRTWFGYRPSQLWAIIPRPDAPADEWEYAETLGEALARALRRAGNGAGACGGKGTSLVPAIRTPPPYTPTVADATTLSPSDRDLLISLEHFAAFGGESHGGELLARLRALVAAEVGGVAKRSTANRKDG